MHYYNLTQSSIVPALVFILSVHRVGLGGAFLVIVDSAATRLAVVVFGAAKTLAETLGANDPAVGA